MSAPDLVYVMRDNEGDVSGYHGAPSDGVATEPLERTDPDVQAYLSRVQDLIDGPAPIPVQEPD